MEDMPNQVQQSLPPVEMGPPQYFDNPFSGYPVQGLPPLPAVPNNSQMIHELLSDDHVPENIKQDFWFVFARDNSLTFLDDVRKQNKLLSFDIIKIEKMNSTPYHDYDFGEEMKWSVMRNAFETKLDRSRGTDKHTVNERTVQQSQFTENRSFAQAQQTLQNEVRESFLKRILGRR